MTDLRRAQVQRIYRPVSLLFGLLAVAVIAGVGYAGWSSTVITVTPLLKKITAVLPVTVQTTATSGPTNLSGTITDIEKSATITVTPQGQGDPVPAHAAGDITIINTTAKVQPLASGTRLKSDGGVIVRTAARVDVPAGGQVTARVVADPLGESGNLPPGRFVIVALWPGLQDKIYGQTDATLTGGLAAGGTTLSLDQLTTASDQAEKQLRSAAGPSSPGTFIVLTPVSVVSDPKPAIASATYLVTVKMKITTVTYDTHQLDQLLQPELQQSLDADQVITQVEPPTIAIQDRPTSDQIVLEVTGQATASLPATSSLLSPTTLTGLTAADIKTKLLGSAAVKTVSVKLSPWWRTTSPDQPTRITITLKPAAA